jgi:hypothetical protein
MVDSIPDVRYTIYRAYQDFEPLITPQRSLPGHRRPRTRLRFLGNTSNSLEGPASVVSGTFRFTSGSNFGYEAPGLNFTPWRLLCL